MVSAIENGLRVVETEQQRTGTTLFLRRQQVMSSRHRAGALAKSLETEHLATDWAD
ncbi:MAG TPA: hypothetical protein VEZ51_06240 [Gemmatimonadaceae bacterium]|nr:hypothetical protein [Gemmatimonadaceae bacterium]